ncbi:MAG: response regulator [Chloroflexi bacterium]|nr:response regulator [Chloroflexota bacterium]
MVADILVIDHNISSLHLLRAVLMREGYKVRAVTSGEEGLKAASRQPPDLILLDVIMPGMDGFTVCRLIQNDPTLREVPVIFMTSLTDPADKVTGFEAGAVDYIVKPLEEVEVLLRVKTHLRIRQQQEQERQIFQELTRLQEEFIASLSHDLRNPVGSIKLYIDLLSHRLHDLDDRSADYLHRMKRQAQHIEELVNDVLDLAKTRTSLNFNPEITDLAGIIADVLAQHEGVAASKGIRLRTLPPADAVAVRLDRAQFSRALHNLISNAIKYTAQGGEVRVAWCLSEGEVSIRVADTGIGIEPEALLKIFQRFYRADNAYQEEGTGLGLAIVESVAQAHGGSVSVESTPGQGSIFTLSLPAPTRPDRSEPAPLQTGR